jgi:predicted RNA-binding Zn ribbon-like protein
MVTGGELLTRWLLLYFLAALVAACTSGAAHVAVPPTEAAAQTSEAVRAALKGMESLDSAVAQFAGVLGVQPDQVRVRIQDSGCSVCSIDTRAKLGSMEGLSVDEATP